MNTKALKWIKENGTYGKFLKMKNEGELFDFKEITYPQLFDLYMIEQKSNRQIAELFNVTENQVSYKRDKWDLQDGRMNEETMIKHIHHFRAGELLDLTNKGYMLSEMK